MNDAPTAAEAPLVVTLRMGDAAAARFTALRRAHFPPHRNWLDAHVTFFHALPGASLDAVLAGARLAAHAQAPFDMRCTGVRFLGAGVAFVLASPEGVALRASLALRWSSMLGRQDQALRRDFHVTVQNKAAPDVARALHAELSANFAPHDVPAVGLDVWHYAGGPWRAAASFPFEGGAAPAARRLPTRRSP